MSETLNQRKQRIPRRLMLSRALYRSKHENVVMDCGHYMNISPRNLNRFTGGSLETGYVIPCIRCYQEQRKTV